MCIISITPQWFFSYHVISHIECSKLTKTSSVVIILHFPFTLQDRCQALHPENCCSHTCGFLHYLWIFAQTENKKLWWAGNQSWKNPSTKIPFPPKRNVLTNAGRLQSFQISRGRFRCGQDHNYMTDLRHVVLEKRFVDAKRDDWDAILQWFRTDWWQTDPCILNFYFVTTVDEIQTMFLKGKISFLTNTPHQRQIKHEDGKLYIFIYTVYQLNMKIFEWTLCPMCRRTVSTFYLC